MASAFPFSVHGQESSAVVVDSDLSAQFADPPVEAHPRVWWHWMNGNITQEGIRKDLEWMARVGIGGVQNFDAALQTPQIVDERLIYMTEPWKDALRYAVELADSEGLEFAIAASPGWSETGGPWVPPADGMKKLVWSELVVAGGAPIAAALPAPPSVTGTFQDRPRLSGFAGSEETGGTAHYYGDAAVIAYPVSERAAGLLPINLSGADGLLPDIAKLRDESHATGISVPIGTPEEPGHLIIDFGKAQEVQTVTLAFGGEGGAFGGGLPLVELQRETAQGSWKKVADIPIRGPQTTLALEPISASRLRLRFTPVPPFELSYLGSVPGAVTDLFPTTMPTTVDLAELRFSSAPQIDQFELKAGFAIAPDYYQLDTATLPEVAGVDPETVIDLSEHLRSDGTLDWTPPPGMWRILRFGYSLVGTTNHPATPEATGLEVDKYDSAAVERYLEHYIGMMEDAVGPELVGERGIGAILTDSTEIGASNWTPGMSAKFRELRGYDPVPWLPALTGTIVGSRAQSDRFLYDFRATLADLMASEHYWQLAETAHSHGLTVYGEALEAGRPVLGNELAMRAKTDVPMAAMWTYDTTSQPRFELLGDMKGAASVAHVGGQNIVAAESLTAAFSPWAFAPVDLKPVIDLEFAYGINRPVVHTSVHQPSDMHVPGLSLGPFGQYFNRHDTWAEMAKPWVDYIARSSFLLQQGRYFADVAYFYGEDAPLTVLYSDGPPKDTPQHYAFDFVSPDMLANTLSVENGDLVSPAGARFRVLYLGGTSAQMTLPTLRRIAALAEAGATVVGQAPQASPSLADDGPAFAELVSRLWSGERVTRVGLGSVIEEDDVERALADTGLAPDFSAEGAAQILFLHRQIAGGDIYFLSNREDHAVQTEARFRVAGKAPELWDAATGTSRPASYRTDGAVTAVPLDLAANDAVFVVFREDSQQSELDVASTSLREAGSVAGPWRVTFEEGRGAPAAATMAELRSLSESGDPGIRYFSGTATYSSNFSLPAGVDPGLVLDLGQLADVAEVYVNDRLAGTVWKAPYRLPIGDLVEAGENTLEVRVANLWVNRLIGDAQPGADPVTFTAMPTYKADAPLRSSGLLGPVRLMTASQ